MKRTQIVWSLSAAGMLLFGPMVHEAPAHPVAGPVASGATGDPSAASITIAFDEGVTGVDYTKIALAPKITFPAIPGCPAVTEASRNYGTGFFSDDGDASLGVNLTATYGNPYELPLGPVHYTWFVNIAAGAVKNSANIPNVAQCFVLTPP